MFDIEAHLAENIFSNSISNKKEQIKKYSNARIM